MFTGIVSCIGVVRSATDTCGGKRFVMAGALQDKDLQQGASVLHSGVCLTIAGRREQDWIVEAMPETLRATTLGEWRAGSMVNLEPALRMGDALGGHFLSGHVDRTVQLLETRREGEYSLLRLEMDDAISPMIVNKGAVALDGVSLTVAAVAQDWFEVALIGHTRDNTNLGSLGSGDKVNLETDMIARYAAAMLANRAGAQ